jgi:phosphate transport system substrate-binding protein
MNAHVRRIKAAAIGLLAGLATACTDPPEPPVVAGDRLDIHGAGATFPAPLYRKWIEVYGAEHAEVGISYDAVGSGEGIKRFIAEAVDFGASDAAMKDSEIAQVARGVRLVPATAGMVVLAYNIWGLDGVLKLKRDVYVDIFLGKIRKWNDPRIATSNPGIALPDMDISTVVRVDSSGTTYAFTSHLSAISDEWRRGPGTGKLIDWPGRASVARGNEGVAGRLKLASGSIGYVEYGFARRLGLAVAILENQAGELVAASPRSGQIALASGSEDPPSDLRIFISDPEGPGAYPIVSYSWLLLYARYAEAAKANALRQLVDWGLHQGQRIAEEMGYIPLPDAITAKASEVVAGIQ